MLAVHVGACTLLRLPEWESVTGAAWISGQSMHPKTGPSPDHHLSRTACHLRAGGRSFDIIDERYAYLRTAPDIVPLAAHEHEGELHPLLWARQHRCGRGSSPISSATTSAPTTAPSTASSISRAARWLTGAL